MLDIRFEMPRRSTFPDLTVDFLVPAGLASRYRARLIGLTSTEATLSLPFCPSLFRSGGVVSCRAELSLAADGVFVRLPGLFQVDGGRGTTARLRFSTPLSPADLQALGKVCALPADASPARTDVAGRPPTEEIALHREAV